MLNASQLQQSLPLYFNVSESFCDFNSTTPRFTDMICHLYAPGKLRLTLNHRNLKLCKAQ